MTLSFDDTQKLERMDPLLASVHLNDYSCEPYPKVPNSIVPQQPTDEYHPDLS